MARVQIVSLIGSLLLLVVIVGVIQYRKLDERYSLLWLATAVGLVILSLWRSLLRAIALTLGIAYAPTALFVMGFGGVLLILLQFSITISGLARENKRLAQEVALLRLQLQPPAAGAETESEQ
jgi:hypothetical protein